MYAIRSYYVDGLVVDLDVPAGHGPAQRLFEPHAVLRLFQHAAAEDPDAAAAQLLGAVQGDVGLLQNAVGRVLAAHVHDHAVAGVHGELQAVHGEGPGEGRARREQRADDRAPGIRRGEHEHELVAAEARNNFV